MSARALRCKRSAVCVTSLLLSVVASRPAWAVQGGSPDGTTTHSVAIGMGEGTNALFRCTGTLISPRVVLTVRHCLSPVVSGPACPGQFGPATSLPTAYWVDTAARLSASNTRTPVASWVFPRTDAVCGNDLALLVLAKPVPRGLATPAVPTVQPVEFERATDRRIFGLVGFGESGPALGDTGSRRSRFDVRIRCVPGDARYPCDATEALLARNELTSLDGACPGDSGSGALDPDDPAVVFAVLSRANLAEGCGEGIFVRTDSWAWLLGQTALDATGPGEAPPAWASTLFPAVAPLGGFCRSDASCADGAACVSLDEERSFVCAARCEASATCGANGRCEQGVCVARAASLESGGCQVAGEGTTGRAAAMGLAALALAAWRARRRGAPARPR